MMHQRRQQQIALLILMLTPALIFCGGVAPPANVEATVAAGIAATQQSQINLQATINAAVAATQTASRPSEAESPRPTVAATTTPVSLATATATPDSQNQATSAPDPEQVRAVILSEINGAIAQDLEFLKTLYAPNAVVIDRNGTPNDLSDDTTWRGWPNIERRYLAFFSAGYTSLNLVDLSIQMNDNQATGAHRGAVLDGILYPDLGKYTLEKINGQWLITQLEFGNKTEYNTPPATSEAQPPQGDEPFTLEIGSQHRYEEPWGWDRGDPCEAWATGNFDDTNPNYRGFNVELLLTNNTDKKLPDAWPVSFTTAKGKSVKACYYGYDNSGPAPGATSSVTFFTVVEKGDYVETITFSYDDYTIRLCLDGKGDWWPC